MFRLQAQLDEEIRVGHRLPDMSLSDWIQKEVLAIMVELGELLEEVNFKWWKVPRPLDPEAIKGELVDILHFFISMCLKAGIGAEDLYRAYIAKNEENFRRQRGLSSRDGYAPESGGR
ncbi:MAG TPA: dUTPase [Peptococcaceae bacterium]|nr:dUTPase [Peptococcaceae bacterium]